MSESEQDTASQADRPQQQFALQKIYLKDLSFETPNSPAIFTEQWEPAINVELQSSGKPLAENVHDVVLTVTVTAKLGDKIAYLVEVQQAGVFTVAGFSDEERAHMLGSYCPNILFPFAREAIADLVAKGGFPQMLLGPVNFDAMYAEHLQRQQQARGDGEAAVH
ncbi:MAG TPA: protein-export chaperone SecB [Gammaproteobacteria bacterium]|nr:protein-export chaperone SecB [Gammaproteobacteria bacterium]